MVKIDHDHEGRSDSPATGARTVGVCVYVYNGYYEIHCVKGIGNLCRLHESGRL